VVKNVTLARRIECANIICEQLNPDVLLYLVILCVTGGLKKMLL